MKSKGTKTSGKSSSKSSRSGSTDGIPESVSGRAKLAQAAWLPPHPLDKNLLNAGELRPTLTSAEKEQLRECEAAIQMGWKTFIDVGNALLRIRDSRLYRDTHKDFEAYCRTKWDYQRAYAYRLMGAAATVKALSPIGDNKLPQGIPLPSNEAQVRPLVNLKPKEAREIWISAVKQAKEGHVTAKMVQTQVKSRRIGDTKKTTPKKTLTVGSVQRTREISTALDKLESLIASTPVAAKCRKVISHLRKWIG